jgi:hypothetical protein
MTPISSSAGVLGTAETLTELWALVSPSTGIDVSVNVPNAGTKTLILFGSSYSPSAGYTAALDGSTKLSITAVNASAWVTPSTVNVMVAQILGEGLSTAPAAPALPGRPITNILDKGNQQAEMQYSFLTTQTNVSVGWTFASSPTALVTGWWKEVQMVPYVPVLQVPANNATSVSTNLTLSWLSNAGPTASSFGLQICSSSSFIANDISLSGIANQFYFNPSLGYTTDYWWRVNATDASGTSDFTSAWKFTTGAATSIKAVSGMAYANIKAVSGLAKASISKIAKLA